MLWADHNAVHLFTDHNAVRRLFSRIDKIAKNTVNIL